MSAITLTSADWLALFGHFLSLSLMAVGGAITTAPDMHRYLVTQQHWLTDEQFTSSIAIAQAAPGPNVLFVGLMGWNVGLNAAGGAAHGVHAYALGFLGLLVAMPILFGSLYASYQAIFAVWADETPSSDQAADNLA